MKQIRKRINHFRLLTTGKDFAPGIAAVRKNNGQNLSHLLNERIVFSLLAYRARRKLGASVREIARETGLHPRTVKTTLVNVSDLAYEHDGRWYANEPPDGWFQGAAVQRVEHWSDRYAYVWLFLPRKGATFEVGPRSRRFSLNHAVVWSFLFSLAGDTRVIGNFSVSGLSKMLHGMNRKTLVAILDELSHLGMIERRDLGRRSEIRLLDLTEDHLALFAPRPEPRPHEQEGHTPAPRPTSYNYDFKQDGSDELRELCQKLMPQSYAERAIRATRKLGWDYTDFHINLENSKATSEENVRLGKCPVENFGKFFVTPLEERVHAIEKRERQEEAEARWEEYRNSPAGRKAQDEQNRVIAASPRHRLHCITRESLTDRVRFSDTPIQNILQADQLLKTVSRHCDRFLEGRIKDFQQQVYARQGLLEEVTKLALDKINHYYQRPVLATPEELKVAIDEAIGETVPRMPALFGMSKSHPEAARA